MTAMAASNDDVVLSKDMRTTIVTHPAATRQPYVKDNAGLTTIFDNLGGKYPDGVYWCCTGYNIWGPDNTLLKPPIEFWEAAAFTPSTSLNVTKIEVAVGYQEYTGEKYSDVLLSLNNDNAGVPGTAIHTWKVTNMPDFGSCCAVDTKGNTGIPVTAGTQYWLVVSTEKKSDVYAVWNLNDTLQLSSEAITAATYCYSKGTACGSSNGKWSAYPSYPGFAFAVFGK
jgi:hypothetical protein